MRGHVDTESLALCAEGLLSRRRSERIRSHVASCPECAAAQARLTEVPAMLAQVPPPLLPPGIEARLDAALTAEAARRAGQQRGLVPGDATPDPPGPAGAAPEAGAGAVPGPRAPRRPGPRFPARTRLLAAAGGLAVAAGVGYAVAQSSPSPPSPSAPSASRPALAGPASSADHRSEGHAPPIHSAASPAITSPFTVTRSGTRYRRRTLGAQAAAVLAHPPSGAKHSGAARRPSRTGRTLAGCVDKVAGAGAVSAGDVRLVDQARYQGHPATVIVVGRTSAGPGRVYAAGTRCSVAHADLLAQAVLP